MKLIFQDFNIFIQCLLHYFKTNRNNCKNIMNTMVYIQLTISAYHSSPHSNIKVDDGAVGIMALGF